MTKPRTVAIALELKHPFRWHQAIYAGTQRYARQCRTWRCVIDEYPEEAMRRRKRGTPSPYNGIIARATPAMYRTARRLSVPLVNVWQNSSVRACPKVQADHATAGRYAAEHLLNLNLRRFGFFHFADTPNSDPERHEFTRCIQEAGFECSWLALSDSEDATAKSWWNMLQQMRAWLTNMQPPMGICVSQGRLARQLVHLVEERNWSVPQEVAIISVENEPTICNDPAPSLTSIELNWELVGYKAAALLDRLMDGEQPTQTPVLVPPVGVVPRASTDFFAVDDEIVASALRYIARHLHRPLSANDVAQAIAASPRTLRRRFQEHLGRPVTAEIRRLRLEQAKRMLVEPNYNIAEIARTVGFETSKLMWEVFQREVGSSPREYRNELLGDRETSKNARVH